MQHRCGFGSYATRARRGPICRSILLIYRVLNMLYSLLVFDIIIRYTISRMRRCKTCHNPIATSRLAALPAATTCVACSTEQPMKGYMTWEHKTAPVFQVVTPAQHQWLQSRDRKGMRSGLPMSSRGSSTPLLPVAYTQSIKTSINANISMIPMATKCEHKNRPQASSAGKCLECSMEYYRLRVSFRQKSTQKKMLQS